MMKLISYIVSRWAYWFVIIQDESDIFSADLAFLLDKIKRFFSPFAMSLVSAMNVLEYIWWKLMKQEKSN